VSPSLPFSSETLSLTPMHEFEHCEQCEREAESSALLTTNATTGVEFSGRSRIPPRPPLPHRHYQQQQYAPRGPLRMVGGCCFEYCIASNSILLSYFCVDPHMRGKGLARRLADAAERIADNDARRFRRVPRCDAFYLETNKLSVAVKHRDVMNPRTRHQILYNIGFRALNFRFVQPPLSPQSQSFDGLWLCVRISSPHIVTQQQKEQLERELAATLEPPSATVVSRTLPPPPPQQDGTLVGSGGGGGYGASNAPAKRLFMPASFVKKFVIDYWMSCVSSWKTDVHLSTEKELRQMTEEISAKPFIELLELPWDASNPAVAMAMTDRPLLLPPVPSHSLSSHLPQSHSHSHGTVLLHPPLPPSLPSSHLLAKL
jgi:GNAT superfamily N-acetyltransferase